MGTNNGLLLTLGIFGIAAMMMFSILPAMAGGPPPDKVPMKVVPECASSPPSQKTCRVFIDADRDGCDGHDAKVDFPRKIAIGFNPC